MSKPDANKSKPETNRSKTEDRRDVVIYKIEDRTVTELIGLDMTTTGFYNWPKRVEVALERCNDRYSAAAVPVNKYKKGDVLEVADL